MRTAWAWIAVACGCGDVVGKTDGGVAADADPRSVRVTLLAAGLPIQGAKVVFLDPAGALVSEGLTDAFGIAGAIVPAGSSVTAIRSAQRLVYTVMAVEPGDDLVLGTDGTQRVGAGGGFNLIVSPPQSGALLYRSFGRCASGLASSTTIGTSIECAGPATVHVIGENSTGPIGYASFPAIPHVDGVDQTVTASWQPIETTTVALQDVPAEVTSVRVNIRSTDQSRSFYESDTADAAAGHPVSTLQRRHPYIGDHLTFDTELVRDLNVGRQRIVESVAPPPGRNYGTSVGASMLPWVGAANVDATMRTMSWTEAVGASTKRPDAVLATLYFGNTPSEIYNWLIVAPHGASQLAIPALPASAGVIDLPTSTSASVMLFDTAATDYRGARQRLMADHKRFGYELTERVVISGVPHP